MEVCKKCGGDNYDFNVELWSSLPCVTDKRESEDGTSVKIIWHEDQDYKIDYEETILIPVYCNECHEETKLIKK